MQQKWKWFGVVVALMLAACGVKYWPALWSVQFAVRGTQYPIPSSITRELGDGSVVVAYQRDNQTLVVDTYDTAGNRLSQDEFPYAPEYELRNGTAPLFASDDVIYWFGRDHRNSVKVDLAAQTVQPLSDLLALDLAEGDVFEPNDAIVLDNGQVVLAGGDRNTQTLQIRQPRVVVINPDATVQSAVLDVPFQMFTNLVARSGSDQYFVQYFDPAYLGNTVIANTYLGEGATLVEQPQMDQGVLKQADQSGAWAFYQITGLVHYSATLELDWQSTSAFVMSITPTADQHYLMMQFAGSPTRMEVAKLDAQGNTLWNVPASTNASFFTGVTEKQGKILVSETLGTRVKGVRAETGDASLILPITTVTEKVRHRLLNSDGKELARFSEPDYRAVLLRDPLTGTEGTALEYTAGSCRHDYALMLASGDFATVSSWCTDNSAYNQQRALYYFQQP